MKYKEQEMNKKDEKKYEVLNMYTFLKLSSLNAIRFKLFILYLLNVTDALMTDVLIKTGDFYEGNILLRGIVEDTYVFLLLKIFLLGSIVVLVGIRLCDATDRQLKLGNIPINIFGVLYALINGFHLFWIIYIH